MRQMRAFPRKVTMDTYAGRQLLSGRTQEIATRPDFYQISAQSGDMIRVVLIAQDPDGLAAIVLEALAEDLQQQVGDIVPMAGAGQPTRW